VYSSTLSLTSALDGGGWSTPRPGRFIPGKVPAPIVLEAGWATGPFRTGAENLIPTRIRPPDSTARSESLFRLRYPGPPCSLNLSYIKIEHVCPVGNGLHISALFLSPTVSHAYCSTERWSYSPTPNSARSLSHVNFTKTTLRFTVSALDGR
jgi:hypothetical protein